MKAFLTGFFRRMTPYLVMRKMVAAKTPAIPGATTQAAKT
jgi:hypothetical protein